MIPQAIVSKKWHWTAAAILTIAAGALRFYNLDGQSIWNDEMFSIEVARQHFGDIQPLLATHFHHPPLFFYLVHWVFALTGESVWALRLISAIFGSLTIGALYLIVASRWEWKGGVVAALLCCVSPFHIAYSQEGRPYALAAFLALLSCHFFLQMMEGKKAGVYAGYLLSTIALLYTHHWGLFLLATQGIILLYDYFIARRKSAVPLIIAAIAAACYIPGIPALLRQAAPAGSGEWWWAESPSFNELVGLSGAFSGTYFKMGSSLFASPLTLQIAGGACVALVVLLAIDRLLFARDDAPFGYFALLGAGTLAIPFFLSFIRPEIFLWYRYTVILLPLACAVTGILAAARRNGTIAMACAVMLMLCGGAGIFRYYEWEKSNIKAVAAYLTELTREDRMLLIRPPYMAHMLNFYHAGNTVEKDEAYLNTQLGGIVDTAGVFIYVSLDVPNPIRDYMESHFDKTSERVFAGTAHMGIIVDVYRQKPDNEQEKKEEE
jgi:4-amino-4-deoxy-L-arabinose transferase-like glycosyltransferase